MGQLHGGYEQQVVALSRGFLLRGAVEGRGSASCSVGSLHQQQSICLFMELDIINPAVG